METQAGSEDTGTRRHQDKSQDLLWSCANWPVGQGTGAEPQQHNRTRAIVLDIKQEHSIANFFPN